MPYHPFRGRSIAALILTLAVPFTANAADGFTPATITALPFVLMLAAIAVLPLVAEHWWHANTNKAIVSAVLAIPVIVYLLILGGPAVQALEHELGEYMAFILLLTSLYVVSGGIVLDGDIPAHPLTNTAFLALGLVLANVIGTTGASMVLIRPILRINSERVIKSHLPVFFIFMVSNTGGLLTPLGDPPLFLGFLNGVDFFWTFHLILPWLFVNGILLTIFFAWDTWAYGREPAQAIRLDEAIRIPLRLRGMLVCVPLLFGVIGAVLLQSPKIGAQVGLTLERPWAEAVFAGIIGLSLLLTPTTLRKANAFAWGPIVEVAVLFIGIFVTMVPALALLHIHGGELHLTKPWEYFWLTGILSSFLDNAPTYVTMGTVAAGGAKIGTLMATAPTLLAAISCGAVFMGANTYIGNGPNFMVKAIAEESGYAMPSFLGYLKYSGLVLLPVFAVTTVVFF